jgi:hypothetical protein
MEGDCIVWDSLEMSLQNVCILNQNCILICVYMYIDLVENDFCACWVVLDLCVGEENCAKNFGLFATCSNCVKSRKMCGLSVLGIVFDAFISKMCGCHFDGIKYSCTQNWFKFFCGYL